MILSVLTVTGFAENAYLIADDDTKEGAIIDPGGESRRILQAVDELGITVKYILNTHGHTDHVGAVKPVKDATGAIYGIHENDIPMARHTLPAYISSLIPDFVPPPDPDIHLKDGDEITLGAVTLRVIETPGHTTGGLCIHAGEVLFTGDTLFQGSVGRTDFPGGSHKDLVNSIKTKLFQLDDRTVVLPGHGPQTSIGSEKVHNPFVGSRAQLWTP